MLPRIEASIKQDINLEPGGRILVGVSGGPDSLCLLDSLDRLGYDLIVAHLHHGLRPEADEEAAHVQQAAETRNLLFVLERRDAGAYADAHSLSVEEAARELRYQFLFAQARKHGADAVAVGHNADDQVETVLMHFLRGAGLSGLSGMQASTLPNPWSETIPLLRPLLSIDSDEIRAYCQERELEPVFDRSNLDTSYFRNRLRHNLIPRLNTYVPGVRKRLWQMAEILAGDHAVLSALVEDTWQDCICECSDGFVAFDAHELADQPLGLRRRLIRRAVAALRSDIRDLSFEAVERALATLGRPDKIGNLALGVWALLEGDRFYLLDKEAWDDLPRAQWPQLPEGVDSLTLLVPGVLALSEGWRLRAKWVEGLESVWDEIITNEDPYRAWMAFPEGEPAQLALRRRRSGDRIQPLGMENQTIKISDLMINQKIPPRVRGRWPLVCVGERIAWVAGLRLAHRYRVRKSAPRIVHLHMTRES